MGRGKSRNVIQGKLLLTRVVSFVVDIIAHLMSFVYFLTYQLYDK